MSMADHFLGSEGYDARYENSFYRPNYRPKYRRSYSSRSYSTHPQSQSKQKKIDFDVVLEEVFGNRNQ